MLQFIPFEDDWDALELLRPEDLIPYRVGLLPKPVPAGAALAPGASAFARLPAAASGRRSLQGDSSNA